MVMARTPSHEEKQRGVMRGHPSSALHTAMALKDLGEVREHGAELCTVVPAPTRFLALRSG